MCPVLFHRFRPCKGRAGLKSLAVSVLLLGTAGSNSVLAGPRVGVVGRAEFALSWCELLAGIGYTCEVLPNTGPEGGIDAFDVVIDISTAWSDLEGLLSDFVREGKGVITWASTPLHLGIDTDPTVQAWIGANAMAAGGTECVTTATDPILGNLPIGTELLNCAASVCPALADTSGHPDAKILAEFPSFDSIGVLRNSWEGGQSVYLTQYIAPGDPWDNEIILNAVRILAAPPIPAVSDWSLAIMTLLILSAGSIVLLRRRVVCHSVCP